MKNSFAGLLAIYLAFFTSTVLSEQTFPTVEIEPSTLELKVGDTVQLKGVVKDADGNIVPDAQVLFFGSRINLTVTPGGLVTAIHPGEHKVTALSPTQRIEGEPDSYTRSWEPGIRGKLEIVVPEPPLSSIQIDGIPDPLYTGTTAALRVSGIDEAGVERHDLAPVFTISESGAAETDGFGTITGLEAGAVTITATVDEVEATATINVKTNPIRSIELTASESEARTGDVIHFNAVARDIKGAIVVDVPVEFSLRSSLDPNHPEARGAGASAMILDDGRFVAEQQGIYTVVAMSGSAVARASVRIERRDVTREFEFLGQARISDHFTSDFWIWEGVDGRDYAIVGSWGGPGKIYFYDVTDPTAMELVDTVQVDARTVNDVKISEDGRIAVISREGASNRRNGIVILDVSDPRDAKILSTFDDQLTGGVHNAFIYDNHVYAVNNGRRWDVINIDNPSEPSRVSRFETTTPGRSVHDVWVRDGILYQAGATDGIIVVDVGGGGDTGPGGSPERPVEMGRADQITGWNHAVWPMQSGSAGKMYVFAGDETFYDDPRVPERLEYDPDEKIPSRAGGWVHIIEFDDPGNPQEVAQYRVGDFGVHNYWIDWEEELMYTAYYQGGLRVLDVSGELIGDLYAQGREVGSFYSADPEGFIPNAAMVWGPQPHKGTIFFTDHHSGLWAVRLKEKEDEDKEQDSASP
ncbi:MAG: Ig-like domain-containing protein [Proteobacteria bacterium]|nr:Ig-like domain-containing protein [Pseudomonadota bacterium]